MGTVLKLLGMAASIWEYFTQRAQRQIGQQQQQLVDDKAILSEVKDARQVESQNARLGPDELRASLLRDSARD